MVQLGKDDVVRIALLGEPDEQWAFMRVLRLRTLHLYPTPYGPSGSASPDVSPVEVDGRTVHLFHMRTSRALHRSNEAILYSVSVLLDNADNQCREGENAEPAKLHGVIYLRNISDTTSGGISKRTVTLLLDICGEENLRNVVIAVTNRDSLPSDAAEEREKEFQAEPGLCKHALDQQAKMLHYDGTSDSAYSILRLIIRNHLPAPAIPIPDVIPGVDAETEQTLQSLFREMAARYEHAIEELKAENRRVVERLERVETALRQSEQENASVRREIADMMDRFKVTENETKDTTPVEPRQENAPPGGGKPLGFLLRMKQIRFPSGQRVIEGSERGPLTWY